MALLIKSGAFILTFAGVKIAMIIDICLLTLVSLAVIFDLKQRRIPNPLILTGLLFAFAYRMYFSGYSGLFSTIQGLLLGIALLIIPFLMGGMGAGDVKLLGVVGALKGCPFVFSSFLWMALWGGGIALLILLLKGQLKETITNLGRGVLLAHLGVFQFTAGLNSSETAIYYPYALAIGLGVLSTFYQGWC